jgi:hypothetical protein
MPTSRGIRRETNARKHPASSCSCLRAIGSGVGTGSDRSFVDEATVGQARIPAAGSRQAQARAVRPVADRWTHEGYTTLRLPGCFEAVSEKRSSEGVRLSSLS